ncbi:MAG: hypothetical protein MI717_00655, partial [Spirochaetales bacterium]|nr:hypothetical protein [Spirochaetales bacterium]
QETKDLALYIRIARNHFSRKQPIRLIEHPNWDENIARRSKKDGYGFNWPPEYWNNEKTQMVKNLFEEVESLFIKEFRAALEYECALGAIRKDLIDHNVVASDGRSVSKSLDDLLNFINDNHVMTCITAQFIQDHFEKKLTSKDRKFSLRSIQDAILKLGN